ncbi:RecD/TraA family helicase [Clostridium pasteurianum DSM 525 = ATCC 6013]|uniref:ATP-dependent RecD2 DNA helicase n=1 Tax=Clostridium pasteurianum DSM 525 = ATCC 6013 TaxID=1262449 RepID=A0A0H3JBE8_CLOPA|nr:ATP-dependent RecD-like DNA helicase [Clostridium pasteurianum]AJA49605.1 RecD/TraA family helicase [Clostridium pasteurianum DSM 525 = ATCC 6013]AJA53593.1 RecD/TraA family helicase [Clostridium pasteurianum DSM 525 = ATCC 6013]AOZ76759.1 AAA family ATPase [Clostridium pasteurianum DSM 525 = ATCC 6013]AOZ80556.1 AAA family ATPase [Clostridium pasteurianum]ELP58879.1 recombinase D [Clostridium pasteurianum DSM 525 = ATCC 6013]
MSELNCVVEDIVFKNEENGYVVAHVREKDIRHTIVGFIPYITEGKSLKVQGEWVNHPNFGNQLKVTGYEEILPDSKLGIERYLSSGVITGIGPVTAKKIVDKFGDKTLEILDKDINRLSEIEGIGQKKIKIIQESYSSQREIRNIMVFLQTYGITSNQCIKIYKKYGSESIKVVKENPYVLIEDITGIGFKSADKIARSLGVEDDSPFRIQSGINYIINEFCAKGNTYMPIEKLIKESMDMLLKEKSYIEKNIYEATLEQKIKIEIINDENCVFTMPYYYCELGVTKKIITLGTGKYDNIEINIDDEIQEFQKLNSINFAPTQKEAIRGAFQNGIEVITGGPGTGKTTIINCITHIFERASLKVFMAAPTGRAAKRMSEASGKEAKTIHRLLELGVGNDEQMKIFNREECPLECDVIIVDEASMIDIVLMNNLLKAVGLGTRLIIVGDVDQLPSVGPGNVLKDIIESGIVKVVRLKDIFRQAKESMIIVNAHKINNGEMPILNKKDKDFYFINREKNENILDTIIELVYKRLPKFNSKWNNKYHIQVLSPMRKGILGIVNLNESIQQILNPKEDTKKELKFRDMIFRTGDKVMQTKNNYTLKWTRVGGSGEKDGEGIFNGDVGFIEDIDDRNNLIVIFDNERKVIYENMYLDELDLAYAITIHKSQGSEFPVVIIPIFMGPPLLMNRNLLYTAITRAKKLVVLVGSQKAMQFMINNNKSFNRYSGLKWRIMDIMN